MSANRLPLATDRLETTPLGGSPISRLERVAFVVNGVFTSIVLVLLTCDVLWGVVTRFVFGNQAPWTEEMARLLLVWVSLLGGALAYSANAHLGLDLLVARMDPGSARVCHRFCAFAIYLFAVGVMLVGGGTLYAQRLGFGQTMPALGISRSWQYLAIPVGGLLIALVATREMIEPTLVHHDEPSESDLEGEGTS